MATKTPPVAAASRSPWPSATAAPSRPPPQARAPQARAAMPAARPAAATSGAIRRARTRAYSRARTVKAIKAPSRGALQVGSTVTVDPGAAAAWTRAPSLRWASSPNPAAHAALNPRKPRVAAVRTRIRTTAPKAPTPRPVRSVQLMKARFYAICWAGTSRVYDGPTEVPDGTGSRHADHLVWDCLL